jgi:tetratricopeptide (TPR) repeat protein
MGMIGMGKNTAKIMGSLILVAAGAAATNTWAQTPPPTPAPGQQQTPPPAQADKPKDQAEPLTMTPAAPPVNAEEDAAIKAFRDISNNPADVQKKIQAGNDFVQKYPTSRYRAEVYNWLVKGYMTAGDVPKMLAAGEKDLELNPNDVQILAILGSALPRSLASNLTPDEKEKVLTQAEQYSNKAIELAPTITKPAGMPDEIFIGAKNQTMAMAYSGLGLVAFRRGKFSDAIPNLEKSVGLEPEPDPVNYYVLALSNEKAAHFDDAVTAFTKCAAIQSGLQDTCKKGIDEAKKLSATQLSVPK